MNKIIAVVLGTVMALVLTSCGSLTQHIEGENLTPQTIEFAKAMRSEPSWTKMYMTYDGVRHDTDKWYSNVMPFLIFVNWTTLGSFEKDRRFAVRKFAMLFPAFYILRDSLYDQTGKRLNSGMEWNLAIVMGYENYHSYPGDSWKFGFAWIPGVGPCLGFGPSYFQFLWIPFSEIN